MKKYFGILMVIILIMLISIAPLNAQGAAQKNNKEKINETLFVLETKLNDLEDKLDEIEKNQQEILKEINICSIRARR